MYKGRLVYFSQRLGFYEPLTDHAYVMDDYGNAVRVPYTLPIWYWQEV